MNPGHHSKARVSFDPCPPEEFAGRFNEREELFKIQQQGIYQGQMVMLSGARGSGKTSFLDWAEYKIQNDLLSPVIKKEFLETPGMIFTTYSDLLRDLKGHQKFGWFRNALDKPIIKKSIEAALGVLEKFSSLAEPPGVGVQFGTALSREFLPTENFTYTRLLSSFISALKTLSEELNKANKFLAILIDDVQWSSEPDFQLLKDLIRNLSPGISFIITFRLETESMSKYVKLRQELDRYGHTEIRLSGMTSEEIKDFAKRRYGLSIDDLTAQFLSLNVGDPFSLVNCFNLLQKDNLGPSLTNVQKILPEAVNPVRCIYSGLDEQWKDRVDSLCILHPPLYLPLIACMLRTEEHRIARLQDELDQSPVFRRLGRELYDFAHPSFREYRRKELPESVMIGLHSQAARCFEALKDKFPDKRFVALSLAEHLFFGQEYEKASGLNLQFGDQLYDRFDFDSALRMTARAEICAEKTNNKSMLAVALHQKGLILQSIFRFSDAINAYNQSLEIKREIGDRAGEAKTLHQIGMVYEDTNNFDKALEFYNQSLEIERELGNKSGEAISLKTIKALKEKMLKKKGK